MARSMAGRLGASPAEVELGFVFTLILSPVLGITNTVYINNTADNVYYPVQPPPAFNISTLTRLNFSVRICDNAHVLLSQKAGGGSLPLYEIVIGGWANAKSVIRTAKQQRPAEFVKTHSVGPLSCSDFRTFFVSWKGGEVRVGTVTGQSVFMNYMNPSPFPVHFASVAGWRKAGEWRFEFTADDPTTTVPSTVTSQPITTEITTVSSNTPKASTTPTYKCSCQCHMAGNRSGIKPKDPADIALSLWVPPNSTSAARRRRTSARDDRPSSLAMGAVGVVCLACPVLIIVCLDLTTAWELRGRKRKMEQKM